MSGNGGLKGDSGSRRCFLRFDEAEWFDFENEPFKRRKKLPSGSIM